MSPVTNTILTIRQVHWQLQGVSHTASKRHELWSPNGFKWDRRSFLPTLCKFCVFRNLMATIKVYIFGTKYDTDNRASVLESTGVYYISAKSCHELWSTNSLKLDLYFYSPSVDSAFHFITRLHRRRPANATQPNFCQTTDSKVR